MDFCRRMVRKLIVPGLLGVSLVACGGPTEPVVCTAIAVDAIVVTVLDGVSGRRICDATVTAIDGSFTQDLRPFPAGSECTYSGPTERAGLYEIRVTRSGYAPVTVTNVRVSADECHVIPQRVTVSLR
jgi:hypothetical protein